MIVRIDEFRRVYENSDNQVSVILSDIAEYRPDLFDIAFHGRRGEINFDENKPMFFAEKKADAEWYAKERGDVNGTPNIHAAHLDIKKPFVLLNKQNSFDFIDLIKRAGFDIEVIIKDNGGWEIPNQYMQPIKDHSPYDGSNLVDWIYVPGVKQQLMKEGYDGIEAWDVLENTEVKIKIPFKKSQIKEVTPDTLMNFYRDAKLNGNKPELLKAVQDRIKNN